MKITARSNIGPARLNIRYNGSESGEYALIDQNQTFVIYLSDIQSGSTDITLSVKDWNSELFDSPITSPESIVVTDISYDTIADLEAPDIIKQIAAEPGDFSVLQLAGVNTYSFEPARWGEKNLLGRRLVTAETSARPAGELSDADSDAPVINQPPLEYLLANQLDQVWEKINARQTYSSLYYYLLSQANLRRNNIKYLIADRTIFSEEAWRKLDVFIRNFTDVAEKIEAGEITVYRLRQTAAVDLPALFLDGELFSRSNNSVSNGSIINLTAPGRDWLTYALRGRLANPTDQVRHVRWSENGATLAGLDLNPGLTDFSLELSGAPGSVSAVEFTDTTWTENEISDPIKYQLSQVELYPSAAGSFKAYAEAGLVSRTERGTIDFEAADYDWGKQQGASQVLAEENGNRFARLTPVCDTALSRIGCVAQVKHYFTDFTRQAQLEAFVRLNQWPADGRLEFGFVRNGEEFSFFSSPTGGEGHSPAASSALAHDFKIGGWNRLTIAVNPTGEFQLSENETPLFGCERCFEARTLGFFVKFETADPSAQLDLDFIQYDREYLKPK